VPEAVAQDRERLGEVNHRAPCSTGVRRPRGADREPADRGRAASRPTPCARSFDRTRL